MPANLRDYVQHLPECDVDQCSVCYLDSDEHVGRMEEDYDEEEHDFDPMPCSCGLDALLSSSSAERTDGWRTMDSAPKDGRAVLLLWPHWSSARPVVGWWQVNGGWQCNEMLEGDSEPPVAWMPIPAFYASALDQEPTTEGTT